MTFLQPWFLLLLVAVAALIAIYLLAQRQRRKYAVRFTNMDLLRSVAPRRPGWRRHVPAAGVALGLAFLSVGMADPVHEIPVANESKIIMVNIDVSRSMEATDVAPSRLEAAAEAAQQFVSDLPEGVEVGLVSFSSTAKVLVSPTTDHARVETALSRLQPEEGTATGDAILASLSAISSAQAEAGVDESTQTEGDSAAIVLLADGDQQLGVPLQDAADQAAEEGVPVSTITFGTPQGTVVVDGQVIPVPPDPESMAEVAETTGGAAFDAQDSAELADVYSEIQGDVGYTLEQSQLWIWFVAAGFILLFAATAGAILWTGRFV